VRTIGGMAMRVEWVGYGREASEALRAEIARTKGDAALAPVTVVVPSNHVGVAARRLLGSGTLGPTCARGVGLVAVSFVTPYRLAELLGAPGLAASGRRPVSTPVIAAALRASLAEEPGLFAPVATHPATETALVAAYRELREVTPQGLDAIARKGARAADVVRLHRSTRKRLEPAWYDEQDLMRSAAGVLASDPAVSAELGAVVIYLPQRLTRHAQLLFDAIATASDVSVLAGITGDPRADADVVAAVRHLSPTAPGPPAREPEAVAAADRTKIVLASDADEEVRAAVRRVIDAVRAGTPLDRIAILHAGAEPYARLAHEHLAAAGVTTNGPAAMPLAGRVAGRALLELLALPERNFRRQDVFAWLTTAPLLRNGTWVPTAAWEKLSREAAVVAGRDHWDARLTSFVNQLDARVAAFDPQQPDPERPDWQVERDGRRAQLARDLRAFLLDVIDDLSRVASRPRRWAAHSRWAREKLAALVGGASRRDGWPVAERKAAERVDAALDRLAALDPVEGPVGLDVFTRTLALELETDLGRVGRFGDGVLVGPISMGIGLDLDVVVVLGLAEGTFPAPVHEDSLLPDHEREAARDELPLRRARVDRQHRELLASLAGAHRQVLSVPRGDLRRSTDRVPSRWVLDIASALVGARWWSDDLLHARVDWVEHVASFDAGLRTLTFPATEQEHHLRTLLVAPPDGARELAATAADPVLASSAAVVAARRSAAFTRFDGNLAGLSGLSALSPVDAIMSATRLQTWAGCPFAYFMQYILRVERVENPEDTIQISALDKGSLVHEALEEFVVAILDRPPAVQPGPDDKWTSDDHDLMGKIGAEHCAEFEARGVTGRPIFWRRDRRRILAELDRFLSEDDTMRRGRRTRPIAAELAFGFTGADDPVALTLSDGRVLRFRGQADRVDRADDGGLLVLDYKTGSAYKFRGLTADDPDQGGLLLQLAVYGAAARQHTHEPDAPVSAEYWFVSTGGNFATEGYAITPDVLTRVGATLGTIVSGIESGVFASRPTAMSTAIFTECHACDPDELGVTELRRSWDRKRFDPALVPYAQLAEPFDDDEPAGEATTDG
jgi:ATP-dependent helicase/nuclease subunit B